MFETIAMILAVGLLCTVMAGGLYTVVVGLGSAIADSMGPRLTHRGHSGSISLNH